MQNDNDLKPIVAQRTVADKERECESRKVQDGRLNVGEERHAIESVRIPKRHLSHGNRRCCETPEGKILIEKILPEVSLPEQNLVEEDSDKQRKDCRALQIGECEWCAYT